MYASIHLENYYLVTGRKQEIVKCWTRRLFWSIKKANNGTQPISIWNLLLRMMMSGRKVEIINLYHSRLLEKERPASARILSNMPWHSREMSELVGVGLPTALCHKATTYPEAAPRIHPPSNATCPEHCPSFVTHTHTPDWSHNIHHWQKGIGFNIKICISSKQVVSKGKRASEQAGTVSCYPGSFLSLIIHVLNQNC